MKTLRNISGSIFLSAIVSISTPVAAQDVGGFINLMGRIIEQDMRNQGYRQQRQAEERAARQQRQAIAQEQKAREDAARKQEIAFVRRLQTVMSRLGFYDMAIDGDRGPGTRRAEASFVAAFDLPPVILNEEYIETVEFLGRMGFRSARELQQATAAGFDTRDDFVAAQKGGFDNAQDYTSAKRQGFLSHEDYRNFRTSDFKDAADYRLAIKGGFTRRSEFESALAAGFAEHHHYKEFLESGLTDKAAFEEHQAEVAQAQIAFDRCRGVAQSGELTDAIEACLSALIYPIQTTLLSELERLDQRTTDTLNSFAQETASIELATGGEFETGPADVGKFLQEQAVLHLARQKLSCGIAVARNDWASANSGCRALADNGDDVVMQQLASLANSELLTAQDLAAEEARALSAAAEEERHRLALSAGRERLSNLLSSIAEFTASKGSLSNSIDVARAVVRLRQLQDSDDVTQIEQAILDLDGLLEREARYKQFIEDQKTAAQVAHVNARATASAELRRTEAFIADFVGGNIMHVAVNDLLELQETISKAQSSGQDEPLFQAQRLVRVTLDRLNLGGALDAFVYSDTPRDTGIEEAQNGLAITDENRYLLSGHPRDVIMLGNYTPTAPHLVVNLVGATTFEGGTVDLCWIGPDVTQLPLPDHVTPILRKLGAEKLVNAGLCDSRNAMKQDVLVLQRASLLSSDLLEVQPIISGFVKGNLKAIEVVAWSSVGEAVEIDAQTSSMIKDEIIAGVRQGFGFILLDNQDDILCTVIDEIDAAFHAHAYAMMRAPLERHVPAHMSRSIVSLERAFANIQRNVCRIVYAKAEDLSRLFVALDTIEKSASILPIWIAIESVEEGRALSMSSEEERERHITLRRQEVEAAARLQEEQNRQTAIMRENTQNEMRRRYSQEARAAHNDLSELSKTFWARDSALREQFALLFPEMRQWRDQQMVNGWLLDEYQDELIDYGTALWKDRRLEAVLVRANLVTKNPVRGEYNQKCVVLGYLIDSEFEMKRDALEVPCTVTDDVAQWKTGRQFESRWVAP